MAKETYTLENFQARLRQLGAQYKADRSGQKGHVYWVPSTRQWALVRRKGQNVEITYHVDCPCESMVL